MIGIREKSSKGEKVPVVCSKSLQAYPTLCDPWTVACQATLSMGFSRQEHWSGLPSPFSGELPNPGIKPVSLSPALAGGFFTTNTPWEALASVLCYLKWGAWRTSLRMGCLKIAGESGEENLEDASGMAFLTGGGSEQPCKTWEWGGEGHCVWGMGHRVGRLELKPEMGSQWVQRLLF